TGMVIVDQNIDIGPQWKDPTAQLLLNILGAIAEFEDGLISARTKDGLERVKSENRKVGRHPYGFISDPDHSGKFIPVPEKIELARKVMNLRKRGVDCEARRGGFELNPSKCIMSKRIHYVKSND
ncbi:MAG: recombinase family protein, partial [Thermodesulfobium sp.]